MEYARPSGVLPSTQATLMSTCQFEARLQIFDKTEGEQLASELSELLV